MILLPSLSLEVDTLSCTAIEMLSREYEANCLIRCQIVSMYSRAHYAVTSFLAPQDVL
jgi:hypothetical protein